LLFAIVTLRMTWLCRVLYVAEPNIGGRWSTLIQQRSLLVEGST